MADHGLFGVSRHSAIYVLGVKVLFSIVYVLCVGCFVRSHVFHFGDTMRLAFLSSGSSA